jgi:hypothetical protein
VRRQLRPYCQNQHLQIGTSPATNIQNIQFPAVSISQTASLFYKPPDYFPATEVPPMAFLLTPHDGVSVLLHLAGQGFVDDAGGGRHERSSRAL